MKERIFELNSKGMSLRNIAKELNIPFHTVRNVIHQGSTGEEKQSRGIKTVTFKTQKLINKIQGIKSSIEKDNHCHEENQ